MIVLKANKTLHTSAGNITLALDIALEDGEFVALYGPSGAGKTTALRILAGLTHPETGFVQVGDETWLDTSRNINLPPHQRKLGFVFQDYTLFQNMNVRENLTYALQKGQSQSIVDELLEVMELSELQYRKTNQLSGGQKQRIALARALVRMPKLLLLDEPLSALENEMRIKLQNHLIHAHRAYSLTTLLVSHDVAEVYKMANRVIILENGQVKKQGKSNEVFSEHTISGKFQFIGEVLKIEKQGIVYLVSVLIGNNIVRVIGTEEEVIPFGLGDKVMVSSKAFNPILLKINPS